MSDSRDRKRHGHFGWIILIPVMLALYILSVGPMAWLEQHDWIPSIVMDVYAPLWHVPRDRHPWDWSIRWEMWWRNR
jgi:hypothetical protein